MVIRKKKKNEWLNSRCELARLEREKTWETYERNTKQLEMNV